jgi:hypothetical protein
MGIGSLVYLEGGVNPHFPVRGSGGVGHLMLGHGMAHMHIILT